MPARRFDLGFGRVHYLKYFWAPTEPYRPCGTDLSRPGDSVIIEVPPSAFMLPINLATLRVLGLSVLGKMIDWISRTSRQVVFYCHPSEFVHAKDQQFPRTMSKWNRMGMRPGNLSLVEDLIDHLFERHFVAAPMIDASSSELDLTEPLVLRAEGFTEFVFPSRRSS